MLKRTPGKRSSVSVSAVTNCPFSIAQEYATDLLTPSDATSPNVEFALHVPFGSATLSHSVQLTAHRHPDSTEPGRRHDELSLFWDSESKLFPNFHGALRFRIDGDRTRILLEGSYLAPLGMAGRLFDAAVGKRIAHASLSNLAQRIATYLAIRQTTWLRNVDSRRGSPAHIPA